jgi:hypothetical protein
MNLRHDFNNRRIPRKLNFKTDAQKKVAGATTTHDFIATPAGRPVLIGRGQHSPPRARGKQFLKMKNEFRLIIWLRFFSNIFTFDRDSLNN